MRKLITPDFYVFSDGSFQATEDKTISAGIVISNKQVFAKVREVTYHRDVNFAELYAFYLSILATPKGSTVGAYTDSNFVLFISELLQRDKQEKLKYWVHRTTRRKEHFLDLLDSLKLVLEDRTVYFNLLSQKESLEILWCHRICRELHRKKDALWRLIQEKDSIQILQASVAQQSAHTAVLTSGKLMGVEGVNEEIKRTSKPLPFRIFQWFRIEVLVSTYPLLGRSIKTFEVDTLVFRVRISYEQKEI